MAYTKYITKEFVKEFYDIDDITEITDAHMQIAQFTTDSFLRYHGFDSTNRSSADDDLVAATLFFIGEILSKRGIITWTVGEIEEERFGVLTRRFPRWQPMFFFARGMAEGFYDLLPHESYRMEGIQFVRRFVMTNARDTLRSTGEVYKDTSYRGYGWDYEPSSSNEVTQPDEWVA